MKTNKFTFTINENQYDDEFKRMLYTRSVKFVPILMFLSFFNVIYYVVINIQDLDRTHTHKVKLLN